MRPAPPPRSSSNVDDLAKLFVVFTTWPSAENMVNRCAFVSSLGVAPIFICVLGGALHLTQKLIKMFIKDAFYDRGRTFPLKCLLNDGVL